MKNSKSIFLLFIIAFGTVLLISSTIDISGEWELRMETPRGEMTWQVVFDQEEESLIVLMSGERGDVEGEGTIIEDEIEWMVTLSTQMGERTMTYSGTVEGDTMTGNVQMGDFGSMEWSAIRIE